VVSNTHDRCYADWTHSKARNENLLNVLSAVRTVTCVEGEVGAALSVQRLDYGLDDRGSIPGRGNDGNFSHRHRIQTGSAARPVSCSMGTRGPSPGGKAADA
jgi:hypothetical protein